MKKYALWHQRIIALCIMLSLLLFGANQTQSPIHLTQAQGETPATPTLKSRAPVNPFDADSLNAQFERATDGPCKGLFSINVGGRELCSHGFDPEPASTIRYYAPAPISVAQPRTQAQCDGDGISGNRVQVLYVHGPGNDRFAQYQASFQQWSNQMDDIFLASAQETGGTRRVRFVHDASCNVTMLNVQVSSGAMAQADPFAMWNELSGLGYNRTDRKYMVFADTTTYGLGVANSIPADQLTPDNPANRGPHYTSTPANLWGPSNPAHELMHTLGAVNSSAPNGTNFGHCKDEYDRLCYSDGPGVVVQIVCPDSAHEQRFDCNHDDYFHTNPPAGNYLATHWNAANNSFLIGANPIPRPLKTWTGTSSTNWELGGNWTPNGAPANGEDCLIPAGAANYPAITSPAGNECFGALRVAPGATVTVMQNSGLIAQTAAISGTLQVQNGSYFDIRNSLLTVHAGGQLLLQNGNIGTCFYNGGNLLVEGTVQVTGLYPIYGSANCFLPSAVPANLTINPSGLVEILPNGLLSVDGAITNNGRLRQVKTVNANTLTSFLALTGTMGSPYFGVDVTSVGAMGVTTVTVSGNQQCPNGHLLGFAVGRCYELTPTTAQTATIKFYYRAIEANGQIAANAYHYNGTSWDALPSTRGGSGEAMFVQATGVNSYSPFALKDPNVASYYVRLPLIVR